VCSILITAESLYTDYLHGVAETAIDEDLGSDGIVNWNLLGAKEEFEETGINKRQTRISLTYRDVRRVLRLSNRR
jgi:alkylated DNA repair protein alkB family protein 6